jgi:hypothetical protein
VVFSDDNEPAVNQLCEHLAHGSSFVSMTGQQSPNDLNRIFVPSKDPPVLVDVPQ